MCTVHESKKKKYIYIYIYFISCLCLTPIKKLYLSHSHSVPVSLSQITQLSSLSQITLTLCLSFSPKSLSLLSQITQALILSRPSRPFHSPKTLSSSHPLAATPDPAVPRPQITHRRSSLTGTLSTSLIHRRRPDPAVLSCR